MYEFGAELYGYREAGFVTRVAAPADAIARFEYDHRTLAARELRCCRESRSPGAYDEYVRGQVSEQLNLACELLFFRRNGKHVLYRKAGRGRTASLLRHPWMQSHYNSL